MDASTTHAAIVLARPESLAITCPLDYKRSPTTLSDPIYNTFPRPSSCSCFVFFQHDVHYCWRKHYPWFKVSSSSLRTVGTYIRPGKSCAFSWGVDNSSVHDASPDVDICPLLSNHHGLNAQSQWSTAAILGRLLIRSRYCSRRQNPWLDGGTCVLRTISGGNRRSTGFEKRAYYLVVSMKPSRQWFLHLSA